MAVCYRLTAPRNLGKIPKGYVLQVVSACTPKPNACDVEEAIKKEQAERAKRLKAISEKRETERQAKKENKIKTESLYKTISEKTKGKYKMAKSEYAWGYLPTV